MNRSSDPSAFQKILDFIGDETDFEVEYYNESYLERRVDARMHRTSASTYEEYLDLLREDEIEPGLLVEHISVNVTGFFRNPEVWRSIDDLAERHLGSYVEAWSAACSDGREAYSLSMLLKRRNISHDILATDIDTETLKTAYEGEYNSLTMNDIESEVSEFDTSMNDFLVEAEGNRYQVNGLRRNVEFREHDLIADGPVPPKDLVLCRNLLIYLEPTLRNEVYDTLYKSLEEDGFIVLGKSESLPKEMNEKFEPFDRSNRIYKKV